MLLIYNFFIAIYAIAIRISSVFNSKAAKWLQGRNNWRSKIKGSLRENEQRIWIHCASLGEFEQGRNIIEELKRKYPAYKIILSFFSPSGYEIRKDYAYADHVFYLPLDTSKNARDFVQLINPSLVIFVKYEFWYYYLHEIKQQQIPLLLVSAAFRKEQPFFKRYGKFYIEMLHCFTNIFVQDTTGKELLQTIGIEKNVIIAGDTRYDRVLSIAASLQPLPLVQSFIQDRPVLIAGSTWYEDEKLLQEGFSALPAGWKLIIAPHEIHSGRIEDVQKFFPGAILYSQLTPGIESSSNVLIIDNIGMLASLYSYGKIAYVGGGFQRGGIHNVLEPAVFGLPVIIGPVYKKFVEAVRLVSMNCCFPVNDTVSFRQILSKLSTDNDYYNSIHGSLSAFMKEQAGATNTIINYIDKARWL